MGIFMKAYLLSGDRGCRGYIIEVDRVMTRLGIETILKEHHVWDLMKA
jgi:hypothetical protein